MGNNIHRVKGYSWLTRILEESKTFQEGTRNVNTGMGSKSDSFYDMLHESAFEKEAEFMKKLEGKTPLDDNKKE